MTSPEEVSKLRHSPIQATASTQSAAPHDFDPADVLLCGNALVNFRTGEVIRRQWLDGFGDRLPAITQIFAAEKLVVVSGNGITAAFGFDGKPKPPLTDEKKPLGSAAFSGSSNEVVFVPDGNLWRGKVDWINGVISDSKRVTDVGFFRPDIFQSDWFWSGDSLFVSVLGKAHCVNLGDGTVKPEKLHIGEMAKNSSPDHKMTALGTGFGGFAIVDLDAKKVQQMPIRASLRQVYWLGDERAIVLANSDQFQVFNRSSGAIERTFEPKIKVTSIISSSPDRKTLLVGSATGGVFLDLDSAKPLPLKTHMESGAWASPNTLLCSNGSTDSEERGVWLLGCDGTAEKISSEPADANRAMGDCTPMTETPGGCVYVSGGDLWSFDFTSRKLVQLTHGERLPCNLALLAK